MFQWTSGEKLAPYHASPLPDGRVQSVQRRQILDDLNDDLVPNAGRRREEGDVHSMHTGDLAYRMYRGCAQFARMPASTCSAASA
jgi:hypothetical protein